MLPLIHPMRGVIGDNIDCCIIHVCKDSNFLMIEVRMCVYLIYLYVMDMY